MTVPATSPSTPTRGSPTDFDPTKDRHITHQQARAIDSAIDQYNEAIVEHVRAARTAGRDWLVFDLAGVLDGLAQRRYIDDDQAAEANGWKPYPLPQAFAGLDTRFFKSDRTGRLQGGLFGLDGVHPTTSGYAILAGAILDVLRTAGPNPAPLDYTALASQDTLNASPPALMSVAWDLITPFLTRLVTRHPS